MEARKPFNYELFRRQAEQQLRAGDPNISGLQGLLAPVINDLLETALRPDLHVTKEAIDEATLHRGEVGRAKTAFTSPITNFSLNGLIRRNSYPDEARKRFEQEILDRYQGGSSYETIQANYDVNFNKKLDTEELIRITDQLLPQMLAWLSRPLQSVYTCLWVTHKQCHLWQAGELRHLTVYSVIGVDQQGNRDILGHYVANRGPAEFWTYLLHDLKGRGVEDLLMVCIDRVELLRTMINEVYPQTHVHGCLMHQMRSSLVHIRGKDALKLRKDLQSVYQASTLAESTLNGQTVKATWAERYPLIIDNWDNLMKPLHYPDLVRKLTHGTGLVTTCQELLVKSSKVNGIHTTETELLKFLYVTSQHVLANYRLGISQWGLRVQQLATVFGDRADLH